MAGKFTLLTDGRVFSLCCFFVFQIYAAIISRINYYEGENKISQYPNAEYNAEFVNEKIKEKIAEFVQTGYPFVRISPKITEENDSLIVSLFIDKGDFAGNVNAKFIIDGKLRYRLAEKPVENILRKNNIYYNYSAFEKGKSILLNKRYINSVSVFSPEILDTSTEVPIKVIPYNSVFFEGGLGFATFPENTVTGNMNLEIVNVLGFGEVVDFSYVKEDLFYKIGGSTEVPYILGTSFGALFSAEIEVANSLYGSISLSSGVKYFFGENMTAKMTADYSELTMEDTVSRYTGITVSLDNGKRKFIRSQKDFQMEITAKSGAVSSQKDWMPKGEITAKTAVHIPFGNSRFAYLAKPNFGIIAFETPKIFHKTQVFRLGGANSVRGYQEGIFPCLSYGSLGNDFRYYINNFGAIYLLFDYAAIMPEEYEPSRISNIFGYGTGIALPVGKLSFSVEWARHYKEFSSLGRIHFRLGNY